MKRIKHITLLFLLLAAGHFAAVAQDIDQMVKQKPFTINGTFGMGLGTYNTSGIDARERNFSYMFSGSPVVSIYGVSFPFNIVVSDQQRGFRQPFNQYGISPQYKWITVHAGWQSIAWSPFVLAGYNFLGGGVELNPGKLRLGFIYGRFNKAIEETSVEPLSFQTPSYKRSGYAAKLGYGTERNHVDLHFLNIKDDANSIKAPISQLELHPAENVAVGISSKFSLLKHFVWDMDVAASLYTRNILNDTLKYLNLGKAGFLRDLININATSQFLTAGQTSIGYINNNYNLHLQYRRVDPDYKSMGAYYFETDVANYTVQGGINLFKNVVQLNGSLGFQQDNLLHDKSYTSKRNISSFSVTYNKQSFGADIRYANYGITQDRGINPVIDTFRVARTNYNVSSMLRYTTGGTTIMHNFVLVGNLQSLSDLNSFTADQSKSNSKTANLSYQLNFVKSSFGIVSNFNYTLADIYLVHTVFYGPTLGIDKQINKGQIGLNASLSYQQQRSNDLDAGSIINGNINCTYRLTRRDGANLSFIYLKSNSKDVTLPSFNEVRTSFNLTHTF